MTDYRAYLLGADGHYRAAHEIMASSDAEALDQALALDAPEGFDLWTRSRLVIRFSRERPAAPVPVIEARAPSRSFLGWLLDRPSRPPPPAADWNGFARRPGVSLAEG